MITAAASRVTALHPHAAPTPLYDSRTEVLAHLILERHPQRVRRLLVVGCGSGKEAVVLAQILGAETIGIDVVKDFDPAAAALVDLRRGDATRLQFRDRSFDFIYSCHALEHIPDHLRALNEMGRVLAKGGGFCIGAQGRVRNQCDAYASFSSPELQGDLLDAF